MEENTTWANRIQWCLDAGLSQTEVARRCGFSRSTLNDLRKGRSQEPRGMAAVSLYRLSQRHRPKETA
tara:strand:- start:3354 stop:3557 length:204 start_codon:yes stop_codon:yes gene_type:complete